MIATHVPEAQEKMSAKLWPKFLLFLASAAHRVEHQPTSLESTRMSLDANKTLARRIWDDVFNNRNLGVADELVALDALNHEAAHGAPSRGPESLQAAVTWLSAAFPDMHMAIDDVIAEGDKVVLQTTMSGTHQGWFMGMSPTGRRFAQRQVHFLRIQDGKAVEHWAVRDDLGFLQQLGAAPAPSDPAVTA
jgi:steroid delta-isomerase-like uncharacterized protein